MVRKRIPGEALCAPESLGQRTGSGRLEDGPPRPGAPAVGVLGLQGDVLEHVAMVRAAGARAVVVQRPQDLDVIDGLIIPGGESTTIGKLAQMYGLMAPLRRRIGEGLPTFGTCAGAILLAKQALHADGTPADQPLLRALDIAARRNAFGRQVASFEADLDVLGLADGTMHAVFIRAPWFEDVGDGVEVLATVPTAQGDRVVVVRQGNVMACAFHPELSGDSRLHRLFVDLVRATT